MVVLATALPDSAAKARKLKTKEPQPGTRSHEGLAVKCHKRPISQFQKNETPDHAPFGVVLKTLYWWVRYRYGLSLRQVL